MSTRCVIAAVTEVGVKGVYVHGDGYPDGSCGKLATLPKMIADHGLSKVVGTLLASPAGWYSFDGGDDDYGLDVVPGFGNRFTAGMTEYYTDAHQVDWDLQYVYLIHPDGSIQWADKGVTQDDVPWSALEWCAA